MGHDVTELVREQRTHEHFGTVVLGIFAELFDLRVLHEHLINSLDDDTVSISEITTEAFIHFVDDALESIFLFVWDFRSGATAGYKYRWFLIQYDCTTESLCKRGVFQLDFILNVTNALTTISR